jgi:hypothetical protein
MVPVVAPSAVSDAVARNRKRRSLGSGLTILPSIPAHMGPSPRGKKTRRTYALMDGE